MIFKRINGPLAHLVEHHTFNVGVAGSSPARLILSMPRYEIIPHTADIGIKAYGTNLSEVFKNTAYAMFDIIADLDGLTKSVEQPIEVEAANREELLVAWLGELLYNFYTKQIIFFDFKIEELSDTRLPGGQARLKAQAFGRHIGENRNRLKTEIKAVTYHELKIQEKEGKFTATVIFDV